MTTARGPTYAYQAALEHDVAPALVLSRDTSHAASMARWRVMKRLRADGFSLNQIGRWMGRHHTTVLHGLAAVDRDSGVA